MDNKLTLIMLVNINKILLAKYFDFFYSARKQISHKSITILESLFNLKSVFEKKCFVKFTKHN